MIDTHCHLYSPEFENDIEKVVESGTLEGITKFYMPAIDSEFTERMDRLEKKYPNQCFAMAGLHPCSVKENYEEELDKVKALLQQRKFCGIGETGLDFYWDKTFAPQQYDALEQQIQLSLQYDLPLILHTRNATQETIDVIKKYSSTSLKGIFHCFGGSLQEAEQIIDLHFYLGIGGVITYKNAGLAEVLMNVDMKHIVLETDAPYLSPVPMRGKRNESSYLKYIAEKLALVKNISIDEVKNITTLNAEKIFGV
ncbi:MAG: TatD family hydrolase [Ferruginibacter sp.]|nr:TatD family hydrolase [Ferruginibacter sp.]